MIKRSISVCLLLLLALTCYTSSALAEAKTAQDEVKELYTLINQRLSYMKDVAAYKYVNKVAVEDKEREKVVLASSVEAAAKQSLTASSVEEFFALQIELAKKIQWSFHKKWDAEGFPEDTKFADLKTEVRPQLLTLGKQITEKIAQVVSTGVLTDKAQYQKNLDLILEVIQLEYIDDTDKTKILDALMAITVE